MTEAQIIQWRAIERLLLAQRAIRRQRRNFPLLELVK